MFFDTTEKPTEYFDVVVGKFEDAIFEIASKGIPVFISFDCHHGYNLAKWLVNSSIDGIFSFPNNFSFCVHNGSVFERNIIEALLNNYLYFQIPALLNNATLE
jgi:hypothetical protein